MDFSEKDAARSKWKLSQRHSRGRGRGRGGSQRGGRRQAAAQDLGTNEDRYFEPEADPLAGPVRKSQGTDLAALLESADAFDTGFYHRSRADLLQDYGLPPADALSYQGLSFDLKGLAACLLLLPKGVLLGTDAFDDGNEEEGEEAAAAGAAARTAGEAAAPASSGQAVAVGTLGRGAALGAVAARAVTPTPVATVQQPTQQQPAGAASVRTPKAPAHAPYSPPLGSPSKAAPSAQPAAGAAAGARVPAAATHATPPAQLAGQDDELLDELLGLLDISPRQQAQQAQQPALQQPAGRGLMAPTPPQGPVQPPPLQQQQQQPGGSIAGGGVASIGAPAPQKQEQSLDDWLDSL